jgi:hypothetical protein
MLNSDFVRQRSRAFAHRLLASGDASVSTESRLEASIRLAYGRGPSAGELELGRQFLQRQEAIYPEGSDRRLNAWTDYCQMLLASNEFLYVE